MPISTVARPMLPSATGNRHRRAATGVAGGRCRASGADPAAGANRARDSNVSMNRKQQDRPGRRRRKAGERRQHRRARVLMRERYRGQNLLQRMSGNAERNRRQRAGDRRGVARAERAALEQGGNDRPGQHCEADRRRQRKPQRGLECPRLRCARCGAVIGAYVSGDGRRHHRGDRDRDDPSGNS